MSRTKVSARLATQAFHGTTFTQQIPLHRSVFFGINIQIALTRLASTPPPACPWLCWQSPCVFRVPTLGSLRIVHSALESFFLPNMFFASMNAKISYNVSSKVFLENALIAARGLYYMYVDWCNIDPRLQISFVDVFAILSEMRRFQSPTDRDRDRSRTEKAHRARLTSQRA